MKKLISILAAGMIAVSGMSFTAFAAETKISPALLQEMDTSKYDGYVYATISYYGEEKTIEDMPSYPDEEKAQQELKKDIEERNNEVYYSIYYDYHFGTVLDGVLVDSTMQNTVVVLASKGFLDYLDTQYLVKSIDTLESIYNTEDTQRVKLCELAKQAFAETHTRDMMFGPNSNEWELATAEYDSFSLVLDKASTAEQLSAEFDILNTAIYNTCYTGTGWQANLIGDSDSNGTININDVTAIQKALTEEEDSYFIKDYNLDSNRDLVVDINDATALQRYLADIPTAEVIGTEDDGYILLDCQRDYWYRINSFRLDINDDLGFAKDNQKITLEIRCKDDDKLILENAECEVIDNQAFYTIKDNRKKLEYYKTYSISFIDESGMRMVKFITPEPMNRLNDSRWKNYNLCSFASKDAYVII